MRTIAPILFFLVPLAPAWADDGAEVDYEKHIQPILEARCYSCHGPEFQDGDLRLDVKSEVFTKDESKWVIKPGDAAGSSLYKRVILPADDFDIMPAEGDPLSASEQDLIRRWIDQGAKWPDGGHEATEAPQKETMVFEEISEAQQKALEEGLKALQELGALAMRIAADTDAVEVNFSLMGDKIKDEHLGLLAPLAPRLVWLNLARTAITDKGLSQLASLTELRRLNLSRTSIDGSGLAHLGAMKSLDYLNLYGTGISDDALSHLGPLGSLQKVFLWQSKATKDGIEKLRAALPAARIDHGDYVHAVPAKKEGEAKKAINANCPVSGTPVKAGVVSEHEGNVVGFCCGNCKAKFDGDPASFLGKIPELAKEAEASATKAVNAKCPVSGAAVKAGVVTVHDGKAIGFCCANCQKKFEADPAAFADKIPELAKSDGPVNAKCPVSRGVSDESFVVKASFGLVAFCCGKCKATFTKKPEAFIANLSQAGERGALALATNESCPVSGQPLAAGVISEHEGKWLGYCCGKCRDKFQATPERYLKKKGS